MQHAASILPAQSIAKARRWTVNVVWDGGGKTFIHEGTNGRWRDVLTQDGCAAYEALAVSKLGRECAAWLARR